ncbi:MAG TPA: peptidoglycan-binding protein [Alphaproteobacteria bacterium]|nr:peptidoglycan-binding protein [Alphaproteobacteria bacterium]
MPIAYTELQTQTGQAIVNVFETGQALGNYAQVTLAQGDVGGLSYGRSQVSLTSGNLYQVVAAYCAAPGAQFAAGLTPYLPALQACDPTLNDDAALKSLLAQAGADPVMRAVQDDYFDRTFWTPAIDAANTLGATTGLGGTITYDSYIQSGPGGWQARAAQTDAQGTFAAIGERAWYGNYVAVRRAWLAASSSAPVRASVYRMDAFQSLIDAGNWELALPITVHGVYIDANVLSGQAPAGRTLRVTTPFMTGSDVTALQQALANAGYQVSVDGVYGPATAAAVQQFESARGLAADGIAGPSVRAALGLS